jgi:Tfp pilus assembly protein PilF
MNTQRVALARFDLIASVSVNGGAPVEERFEAPYAFEHADAPLPAGWPFLFSGRWLGGQWQITTGDGQVRHLASDMRANLTIGDVRIVLSTVPRMLLQRTTPIAWGASTLWLVIVVALQNTADQANVLWEQRCPWFGGVVDAVPVPEAYELAKAQLRGFLCPVVMADAGAGGIDAEYIARLLRHDYDGAEHAEPDRKPPPEGVEKAGELPYLPAGTFGPTDEMGGSADSRGEVVRSTSGAAGAAPKRQEKQPLAIPGDGRTEVVLPKPGQDQGDTVGPVDGDATAEAEEAEEAPSEEKEGWGFRDWRDLVPDRKDRVEIREEQQGARERLRIDPKDFEAMQTLAYYQYLEGDFDGAGATYDEMIERFPDSGAVINNKALIYKRLGQYGKEEGMYRLALALDPSDPTPMVNLALNLAHQGKFDDALRWMDRADRLDKTDPYHELHRAKIFAAKGDRAAALQWLDLALQRSQALDILHHIEFRQDIRVDPAFAELRRDAEFRAILKKFYGDDSPVKEP